MAQMSLIPIERNHRDVIFTPDDVARDVVNYFKPTGKLLEPAKGDGVFLKYMPTASWCEVREGKDFFAWSEQVDWIISNPPYSIFYDWILHSFKVAENIVYLIPAHKVFSSYRILRETYKYGGIKTLFIVAPGNEIGFDMGFCIAAVHWQRGWNGQITLAFRERNLTPREPDKRDSSPSQAFPTPENLSDLEGLS